MASLLPSPATVAARGIASKASSSLKEPLLGKQRDAPTHVTARTGEDDDDSSVKEETMDVGNVLMTSLICVMAAGGCKLLKTCTRWQDSVFQFAFANNSINSCHIVSFASSLLHSRCICSGHGIHPVRRRFHCRGHLLSKCTHGCCSPVSDFLISRQVAIILCYDDIILCILWPLQ